MGGEWQAFSFATAPIEIIDGDRGKNYPRTSDFSDAGYCLFLNTINVTANGFDFSQCQFISEKSDKALRKGKLVREDVIMTTRGTVGNVAYYDQTVQFEHIRINSGMLIFRPNKRQVVPKYLYFFLRSSDFKNQVAALCTGSAQPQLPIRDINRIEITLPPIKQQQAIAAILGFLDDKIELNRRMNETLEAMARAIFNSWFVDFDPVHAKAEGRDPGLPKDIGDLFPDRFQDSELGEIPAGWRVGLIGNVVEVFGGATPSTKNREFWDGGVYPFCTPKDMSNLQSPVLLDTERHLTDAGVAQVSSGQLPIGTVLFSSRAPIGYLAIAETSVSVNQGIIAMVCRANIPNLYVLFWAQANMEIIEANANGSTFQEISKKNFRPLSLVVPSDKVLEQFGESVRTLYDRLVSNLRESRTLAVLRDTLLPKLLSGEIRIKDAEKFIGRLL